MKAVILARVSTLRQEKEGLSLKEIQLPKLRDYARERGFEVEREAEFVFSETADQKIRRKFKAMLDYVLSNKVKAIIAFRVDRVTRNYRDAVEIDDLRVNHGIEIHFVDDRLVLKQDTVGRDIADWDLKVFLAKQHINRLKEDAINSATTLLESGRWPVNAPFGYKNVTLENKQKWIVPVPDKALIVEKMFNLYSTSSFSMNELRVLVKKDYGINMSKGMVDKVLKQPFYYGKMIYKGKEYPHFYEKIVSEDLFERVQEIKAGFNKKKFKFLGLPYYYRGLIRCSICGCAMTPEKKKGKYVYYHCTEYKGKHKAKWIREEEITKQIRKVFERMVIPSDVLQEIIKVLKEANKAKTDYNDKLFRHLQREYKKYQNRLDKMYEDRLDGIISENDYKIRERDYRQKQKDLTRRIEGIRRADEEYFITAEYVVRLASRAAELFDSSEIGERRQIIQMTLQNLECDGKNVLFDVKKPFNTILNYADSQSWLPRVDSNHGPSD